MTDGEERIDQESSEGEGDADRDPGQPSRPTTEPRENPEIDEEKLRRTEEEMERVSGN
jgi:hypothetical protein